MKGYPEDQLYQQKSQQIKPVEDKDDKEESPDQQEEYKDLINKAKELVNEQEKLFEGEDDEEV